MPPALFNLPLELTASSGIITYTGTERTSAKTSATSQTNIFRVIFYLGTMANRGAPPKKNIKYKMEKSRAMHIVPYSTFFVVAWCLFLMNCDTIFCLNNKVYILSTATFPRPIPGPSAFNI